MPARSRKSAGWLKELVRRFFHGRTKRRIFVGRFFSNGTKVIQTARNKPQRRQKVKPRKQIVVAKKQRIREATVFIVKLLLLIGGAFFLVANVVRFLSGSPQFAISHIGVAGNKHITAQAIIEQSGLQEGQSIFRANVLAAARAIEELPRVQYVAVRRKLPNEIQIDIRERHPAILMMGKELLVLDGEQKVIERYDAAEAIDVPVVSGRLLSDFSVGDTVDIDGIHQVVEILAALEELHLSKSMRISEINIDDPENVYAVAEESGATIYLGSGNYREKLWRLSQIAEEMERNEQLHLASLERIDMRFESIIPAKFGGG